MFRHQFRDSGSGLFGGPFCPSYAPARRLWQWPVCVLDFATFAARAALRGAKFMAVHLALYVLAGAGGISAPRLFAIGCFLQREQERVRISCRLFARFAPADRQPNGSPIRGQEDHPNGSSVVAVVQPCKPPKSQTRIIIGIGIPISHKSKPRPMLTSNDSSVG